MNIADQVGHTQYVQPKECRRSDRAWQDKCLSTGYTEVFAARRIAMKQDTNMKTIIASARVHCEANAVAQAAETWC